MQSTIKVVLPDVGIQQEGREAPRFGEKEAVDIIQRVWWTHIRKRLFKLLKHTIRAAEHCVSYDILKRVSPLEAELLKEPTIKYKVRFRFAGANFPPFIVFKIFCKSGKHGNKYISGKTAITSTNKAAIDACKLMGYRKYYNQMLLDELQYKKYGVTDKTDVATIRDYVQYVSRMDETPAYFGGRHNYWRRLSLENFPRSMLMYDIVDYAQSGKLSGRLRLELPFLLLSPQNEETSRAQFLAVCQIRSAIPCPAFIYIPRINRTPAYGMSAYRMSAYGLSAYRMSAYGTSAYRMSAYGTSFYGMSERRSYQARQKVSKMRKVYSNKRGEEEELDHPSSSDHSLADNESVFSDEDWEQEAVRLYDWSRSLKTEDIGEN